ncbi:DUF4190 domain-containing protein [bacterium]|nr:DUF4190 domain-containing protein [bacterium]
MLAVVAYVLSVAGPTVFIPWSIAINIFINSNSPGPQDTTGYAFLPFYLAPFGLILGIIALRRIQKSQEPIRGKNYAYAGIIIGAIITVGLFILQACMVWLRSEGAII